MSRDVSGATPPVTDRTLRSADMEDGVEGPSVDGAGCGAVPNDSGRSSGAELSRSSIPSSLSLDDKFGMNGFVSSSELESSTSSSREIDDFPG